MQSEPLRAAVESVPPGRWAVAVSGGADSVALLCLLRERVDLSLHVVHLNHELRSDESDGDAAFVAELARRLELCATIHRRSQIEQPAPAKNPSEQYRRTRLGLYRQATEAHHLDGVLLGHHRGDQIETVLHRLLRGSGYRGLCGMAETDRIAGVNLRRPLLNVPQAMLTQYLIALNQPWREDASNRSDAYGRNRLRRFLEDRHEVAEALLQLMNDCRALKAIVDESAATWPSEVSLHGSNSQADILQEQSIREWLTLGGVPTERIDPQTIRRVAEMTRDAASGPRMQLPGGGFVSRRQGKISIQRATTR